MEQLSVGLVGTSRKPDEHRLPIHPAHLGRLDADLRRRIFLERGYGQRFGVSDDRFAAEVGRLRSPERLLEECDVVVLPNPLADDLSAVPHGKVVWGWPHCVGPPRADADGHDRGRWRPRDWSATTSAISSSTASCRTPTSRSCS